MDDYIAERLTKSTAARMDVRGGLSPRSGEPTGQNAKRSVPEGSLLGDGGDRPRNHHRKRVLKPRPSNLSSANVVAVPKRSPT